MPLSRNSFIKLRDEIRKYRQFLRENPFNNDDPTGEQQRERTDKIIEWVLNGDMDGQLREAEFDLRTHHDWIHHNFDNKDQEKFEKLNKALKAVQAYFNYQSAAYEDVAARERHDPYYQNSGVLTQATDIGQGSLKYIKKLDNELNKVISVLPEAIDLSEEEDEDDEDDEDELAAMRLELAQMQQRIALMREQRMTLTPLTVGGASGKRKRKTKHKRKKRFRGSGRSALTKTKHKRKKRFRGSGAKAPETKHKRKKRFRGSGIRSG